MNTNLGMLRLVALVGAMGVTSSCMTTYDANGHPVQSVDPGVAIAGAAAAGVLGYAIANDNDHHHHHNNYYYGRPYHGRYYR
jgi:hypothetical protein